MSEEVFLTDIFRLPPTQETLAMARQIVSTQISPQAKRLLNNWIQFIADPCLLSATASSSSSPSAPSAPFPASFPFNTNSAAAAAAAAAAAPPSSSSSPSSSSRSSPNSSEEPPVVIGDIDASTQHLIDMQWEKVYVFPPPFNQRVLPKDTIKSSLFGKIQRGYLLRQQQGGALQLDKEVCLKMSNLTLSRQGTKTGTKERVFEDALQELACLRVLARFNHPNIIPLLMYGQLHKQRNTHLALVFPLARCSLADKLRMGEVTLDTIHRVRLQIGSALLFLHSVGYAHRDLSLENVCELWGSGGDSTNFVLIDFGLAKRLTLDASKPGRWRFEQLELDHLTGARFLVGKLRYLGPEFFLLPSNSHFDLPAADVFSFGICLLFMAIQSFPYQSRFAAEPQQSIEWRILWGELANDHFVRLCDGIPPLRWLGQLLYLHPKDRAGLAQVLFPL